MQSQPTALQTRLEQNGRVTLYRDPRGQMGAVCCCQMAQRAELSCLCAAAAHGGPAREQRNGGETELGSIMKTMHLTPLAGDMAKISLLALKMTELCPLPSVLFPLSRFDTWVLDLPQDAETLVLTHLKEPNCPWPWGHDDAQIFN